MGGFFGKGFDPNAEYFFQQGIDKCIASDYSGAIIEFSKAIKAQPTNQNFYRTRGYVYEDLGNDIEAEKDFRKTLKLVPNDYVAAYRLGMVYFRKKDFDNAIKWLKLSYENAPDGDFEYLNFGKNNHQFVAKKIIAGNLGNFLTQVKKYEESLKYLDEAIELDPNYPNPYFAKGFALSEIGKVKEAIPYLEKAEKLGLGQATLMIQMLKG